MYKNIDLSQAAMSNVSEDVAMEFIDSRILVRKPLTQRAFNRAMFAAARCEQQGVSADEAIEITIDKGWQGVVVEYVLSEKRRRAEANDGTSRQGSSFNPVSKSGNSDEAYRRYVDGLEESTSEGVAHLRVVENGSRRG